MYWIFLFLMIFFGIFGALKAAYIFRAFITRLIGNAVFKKDEDIKIWTKP